MDPYFDAFKQYADFSGRTSRNDFWMFVLFHFIIMVGLSMIDITLLSGLYGLATIIPFIAITARRLHDTNKSGWWQLLELIPFVGLIVIVIFCAQPAVDEGNRFGAAVSVKEEEDVEYEPVKESGSNSEA